jgi:hypothetical protein
MRSTQHALLEILEGVDYMDVDHLAKVRFRQLVAAISEIHGIECVARAERLRFAAHLLSSGAQRSEISDRLTARYHLSRSQSYRVLADALKQHHPQLAHKTSSDATTKRSNESIETEQ